MRFLPALALGFSLFAATAHAEDAAACPAKATILSLSDIVLADRDKLPRLKARGYGAEAAYLKIRYGALPMERAADLAHGLRDAGVREALDLAGAIDATRGGLDALDITDPAQLNGQISTLRAILLHGDGEKLLSAIAALPPERQTPLVERIVPAIVDWSDEDKAKLAAAAGKHKMYFLQAGLVVYPAAGFPILAKQAGARLVLINREPTGLDRHADLVIHCEIGDAVRALQELAV